MEGLSQILRYLDDDVSIYLLDVINEAHDVTQTKRHQGRYRWGTDVGRIDIELTDIELLGIDLLDIVMQKWLKHI